MARNAENLNNPVILTLSSPDGPGIVAPATGFLDDLGFDTNRARM